MTYRPPLVRAVKIPRTAAGYRVSGGNIAAIDFGTTSVSLAYTTKGDKDVVTLPLDAKAKSTRILNVILLKKERDGIRVDAFGENAKKKFGVIKPSEYTNYIYFERIKMLMRKERVIDRQSIVLSFSGEKFYLVEVIAFILKYLKDQLIDHLSRTVKPLKTTDFDWVITVPAIWDARGKRMTREAAYLAGLLSGSGGINHLSEISSRPLPLPDEVNPEKLSLALEPESAAFYSRESKVEQAKRVPSSSAIRSSPTGYMVIDIGGGTVDITVHVEVDGAINVDITPTGNAWGGTQVNEAFSQMLQKLIQDSSYKKFLASGNRTRQCAVVNSIIYEEFENQKLNFGHGRNDEIAVSLPNKFVEVYDEVLKVEAAKLSGVDYEDDTLYIDKEVVERQLFGPALDGIIKCTLEAIKENKYKVNTFYLVGGFGGCKYVHKKVTAAIERVYSFGHCRCNVVVPPDPHLAVATGAVMWRKNPAKIKERRSDATYGIATTLPFDRMRHDPHYMFYNANQRGYWCRSVFNVFLEKGEMASADQVITTCMTPASQAFTQINIIIHSTPYLGIQYLTDKCGRNTVYKIGQLVIDIPNPDNLPREKRLVDVTMDFSGTEIQAKAKYRVTGKEVKTVCDFLSTQ